MMLTRCLAIGTAAALITGWASASEDWAAGVTREALKGVAAPDVSPAQAALAAAPDGAGASSAGGRLSRLFDLCDSFTGPSGPDEDERLREVSHLLEETGLFEEEAFSQFLKLPVEESAGLSAAVLRKTLGRGYSVKVEVREAANKASETTRMKDVYRTAPIERATVVASPIFMGKQLSESEKTLRAEGRGAIDSQLVWTEDWDTISYEIDAKGRLSLRISRQRKIYDGAASAVDPMVKRKTALLLIEPQGARP